MTNKAVLISLELEIELRNLRIQNRVTQGFKYTRGSAANVISGVRQYLYFTLHYKITPIATHFTDDYDKK